MVSLDRKDLIKYPFLKEAQQFILEKTSSLDQFLDSMSGRLAVREAAGIIETSIQFSPKNPPVIPEIQSDPESSVIYIAAYPVTRVLLSCLNDRSLIEKTSRYQAWIAYNRLIEEEEEKKEYIRRSLDLPGTAGVIPVTLYLEIASRMPESRWRLINRVVEQGQVYIRSEEIDELARERLRVIMNTHLPMKIPLSICTILQPVIDRLSTLWQEKILEEFGSVEESAFPPCIQSIIQALAAHTHLSHMGRFAITAFLHNIGMENTRIVEIYGRVPDFDLQKTMYQVDHISGRGGAGTEYTSPQCSTMKTHSLCIHRDSFCDGINHPLQYYKYKKRLIEGDKRKKDQPGKKTDKIRSGSIPDYVPADTDNSHKEQQSNEIGNISRNDHRNDNNKA